MENKNYSAEMRNLLTSTLISVFLFMFCYLLWTRRKLYIASYRIPGPLAFPLLGNLHNFIGMRSTEDIFNRILKYLRDWGTPFRIWIGPRLVIIVSEPDDLEIIHNNPDCMQKDLLIMKGMRAALGDGLITSELSLWKKHRKIINPTFNQKILNGFFDIFTSNSKKLVENLKKNVGKGEFNIFPPVFQTTVRFICESSLGTDPNTFDFFHETLAKYLDETMAICFQRMAKPWLYPDFIFNLTSYGREFKKNMQYLSSISEAVIQRKRKELKLKENIIKNNKMDDLDEDVKIKEKKIFIDLLMELNENGVGFTDAELKDQINTFITGGSDTIANEVCFACLLLGSSPECQEKAYAEINEIFGDSDRNMTLEDLSQLKYLERVIKETLRIFPQLPLLVRYIKNDIKFSTVVAPAGSTILFTNFLAHRDPKIWTDPLKFDPDRFLPEEMSKRHPYSYVPFGGGPRNCIGNRYAMIAMKILLTTLIRSYKFKSNIDIPNFRLTVEIIMKAVEGHRLEIELRDK